MKLLYFISPTLILFIFGFELEAQSQVIQDSTIIVQKEDQATFQRKGKILLEMDYGTYIFNGGTGFSFSTEENGAQTNIAFDGGYFTGENFAITMSLNYWESGISNSALGIGFKYYFSSKVPFDFNIGRFSIFGDGNFFSTSNIGYSLLVADNISIEPAIGMFYYYEKAHFNGKVSFSLFL